MDKLVTQRFAELDKKAQEIEDNHVFSFHDDSGVSHYKVSVPAVIEWSTNVLNLFQRVFSEKSVHFQKFELYTRSVAEFESSFQIIRGIFKAAKEDYEGGYLFNITALVKAEVLSDSLEQATVLLDSGYKDPACVLAGISMEITLKELCNRYGISHGKADKMNVELCKAGEYNMAKQKQITAWAELRNKAAHGDWSSYNEADVRDFIQGVSRFMADHL